MASYDDEFKDVEKTVGLCIWRIEDFKLIRVPVEQYGSFYEGDSYLILNVNQSSGKYSFYMNINIDKN